MSERDPYAEALAVVAGERKCSISLVQRRLRIGYNDAARLVDRMVLEGHVTEPDSSGRRRVLMPAR